MALLCCFIQPGRICLNSCFSKQPKEVLHGAKKPKGKVSAFNFFARLKRSEVLKQDNAHTVRRLSYLCFSFAHVLL